MQEFLLFIKLFFKRDSSWHKVEDLPSYLNIQVIVYVKTKAILIIYLYNLILSNKVMQFKAFTLLLLLFLLFQKCRGGGGWGRFILWTNTYVSQTFKRHWKTNDRHKFKISWYFISFLSPSLWDSADRPEIVFTQEISPEMGLIYTYGFFHHFTHISPNPPTGLIQSSSRDVHVYIFSPTWPPQPSGPSLSSSRHVRVLSS